MPTNALTTPDDALSTWDTILAFESRLVAGLKDTTTGAAMPGGYVRIAAGGEGQDAGAYKAEEGIHLIPEDIQPQTLDGGGRVAQRSRIVIQVWVVTRNAQDRAGDYRSAGKAHYDLVDRVVNILRDDVPAGVQQPTQHNTVGIICRWIEGGAALRRQLKLSKDTFVSVHLFEVKYKQKLYDNRVTFP